MGFNLGAAISNGLSNAGKNINTALHSPAKAMSNISSDAAKVINAPLAATMRGASKAGIVSPSKASYITQSGRGFTNTATDLLTGATGLRAGAATANAIKTGNLQGLTNPSTVIAPKWWQGTQTYNEMGVPAAKLVSDAAVGYVTGGPVGAIAAVGGGLAGGDASSKAYSPVNNAALPAASGYMAGSSDAGQAFNGYFNSAQSQGMGLGTALQQGGLGAWDSLSAGGLSGAGSMLNSPLTQAALSAYTQGGVSPQQYQQQSFAPYQSRANAGALASGFGLNGGGSNISNRNNQIQDAFGQGKSLARGVNPNG